jgi:hypothetical protein
MMLHKPTQRSFVTTGDLPSNWRSSGNSPDGLERASPLPVGLLERQTQCRFCIEPEKSGDGVGYPVIRTRPETHLECASTMPTRRARASSRSAARSSDGTTNGSDLVGASTLSTASYEWKHSQTSPLKLDQPRPARAERGCRGRRITYPDRKYRQFGRKDFLSRRDDSREANGLGVDDLSTALPLRLGVSRGVQHPESRVQG